MKLFKKKPKVPTASKHNGRITAIGGVNQGTIVEFCDYEETKLPDFLSEHTKEIFDHKKFMISHICFTYSFAEPVEKDHKKLIKNKSRRIRKLAQGFRVYSHTKVKIIQWKDE